jgi:acyl carrier protein
MTTLPPELRRDELLAILRARVPRPLADEALHSDVSLSRDGLGLDSIAIAEVVLECEDRFGVSLIDLATDDDLKIGELAAALGIELRPLSR